MKNFRAGIQAILEQHTPVVAHEVIQAVKREFGVDLNAHPNAERLVAEQHREHLMHVIAILPEFKSEQPSAGSPEKDHS